MENWKPGDVVAFGNNRAMFVEQDGDRYFISTIGTRWRDVRTARRLVVIDNEFDQTMVKHLRIAAEDNSALTTLTWLADQIEQQAAPRPPEPLGLGAVVEDAEGHKYVRTEWRKPWDREGVPYYYSEIDIACVLSEGVVTL